MDWLTVATYELNMLLRRARDLGVEAHVDTVERDGYTEVVVTARGHDGG